MSLFVKIIKWIGRIGDAEMANSVFWMMTDVFVSFIWAVPGKMFLKRCHLGEQVLLVTHNAALLFYVTQPGFL